ncbi:RHS repeat-associated core domain protein-containing protein [Pseudomonas sp. GM78]|uniref:RHS repeat domain-containing protein n=1 Tax=Pseudomonas sp. GM78 TaxID=1144337 RepID=UPI000270BA40|nr:RHS repeat-associated core domain-containing protein [Pseudomonas sp. GM78]EJN18513.1 RHS repeat-associated core domain protein-containing protein [Pseudomonas sp. GM78]
MNAIDEEKTAVHSNAFNFKSFVQSGVDPRTGLYTVGFSLHEVEANDLRGPVVPLKAHFNPINTVNNGYGVGWSLGLTQYTPSTQIIAVHSGESFKVTGNYGDEGDANRLKMKEQKIQSFKLYQLIGDPRGQYKVVHTSGLVEILKLTGATPQVAMPAMMYSSQGHEVTLEYGSFGDGRMLSTVRDSTGLLLEVLRNTDTSTVEIRVKPVAGVPSALFVLHLEGDRMTRLTLPTSNNAGWRFLYGLERDQLCIKEVWTPLGSHERIQYNDEGHGFPGNIKYLNLPRVTDHVTEPGAGQPPIKVKYSYSGNNFLGYNAPIDWKTDGEDNLYEVIGAYQYEVTESLMVGEDAVRTVHRTFNRFHLLVSEETTQGTHRNTVKTTYYANDTEPFDKQVRQCQLPKQVVTRWELTNDAREWREDKELSEYDIHGNQTLSVQASGVTEATTYFPAEGVAGECPKDPYGFVRHVREKTVTPTSDTALVPDVQTGAPILRSRYRYVELPGIRASTTPWVALVDERLLEVNALTETQLEHSVYTYIDQPDDAFLHGQRNREVVTLGNLAGCTTFTDFTYTRENATYESFAGETVLRTLRELSNDLDTTRKSITEEVSLFSGLPVLISDKDVKIRNTYDPLGRVLTETVAPGTDNSATRTYRYTLIRPAGPSDSPVTEQASQELENVKGVITRTWFDGLSRAVREAQQDVDNAGGKAPVMRDIYEARYNPLGQLINETEIDWLETRDLRLTSTYTYDDWSQQDSETGPDGVKNFTRNNPITFINEEWIEGMGKTRTLTNRFEKPVTVERFDLGEKRISLHSYKYDGLARTASEMRTAPEITAKLETRYVYDVYGRMTETTLPDRNKVVREYAAHSRGDLPTLIRVNATVLGTQTFDGLERMKESVTGGRKTIYEFDSSQSKPDRVIQPSGDVIAYDYMLELTEEPTKRTAIPKTPTVAAIEASYFFDPKDARLESSSEQGLVLSRTYNSQGEVNSEKRVHDGNPPYEMFYVYSRAGRLIRYIDVLKQVQHYEYDDKGRLEWTALGEEGQPGHIKSEFTYTAQGQTESIHTREATAGQSLKINLEYDASGRETLRVFDFGDSAQRLSQTWNGLDQLMGRLLSEGADAGGTTLRDERYEYELRGRLEFYSCSGPLSPVDPYGKTLLEQLFFFSPWDNIEEVRTKFVGGTNIAKYAYEHDDPAQLSSVTNDHADYPNLTLNYDANGNLLQDEEKRILGYDALGRLASVSEINGGSSQSYRYDSENILSTMSSASKEEQRFYRRDLLANRLKGEQLSTFVRAENGVVLAEHQAGVVPKSLLLASDEKNSVLSECGGVERNHVAYSPYGHADGTTGAMGYNGELREKHTDCYFLGNGYRVFNPKLMLFQSPDNWSPFGSGGLNTYAYCLGNPVGFTDHTGHMGVPKMLPLMFISPGAGPTRQVTGTVSEVADVGGARVTSRMADLTLQSRSRPSTRAPSRAARDASPEVDYSPIREGQVASLAGPSAPRQATRAVTQNEPKLVKGAIEKNRANFPDHFEKLRKASEPGTVVSKKLENGLERFNLPRIEGHDEYFGVPKRAQGLRKPAAPERKGRFQHEQQ